MNAPQVLDSYEQRESGLYVPSSRRRDQLLALDLFAGAGGFSLGMKMAGIEAIAAVEWDPDAVMTYLTNLGSSLGCALTYTSDEHRAAFQKALKKSGESNASGWIGSANTTKDGSGCRAMVVGDATKVTGDMIRETLAAIGVHERIDIAFGGPPCQGFSTAGKQDPADPRNNLVLEFLRITDEVGADVFVMENVPPLLNSKKFAPLRDEFLRRANELGYSVTATIMDAANYGVPQFRRRALFAGLRGEAAKRPFAFPMPTHWALVADVDGEREHIGGYGYGPEDEEAEGQEPEAEEPDEPEAEQGELFR